MFQAVQPALSCMEEGNTKGRTPITYPTYPLLLSFPECLHDIAESPLGSWLMSPRFVSNSISSQVKQSMENEFLRLLI